jgi:site-specific DNA recombinase
MAQSSALPMPENGSNLQSMVGAVIYVRVSDPRQAENLSLATQLRTCEEYCHRQGLEIVERFREQGESAKTADRTELQRLLQYCRTHKGKVQFVVVFNLTRFAREKYDHFALRAHLKSLGISLRSATEPIDDTATGKLMEGVLAAFAQFDNDCRSDRTRAGMRAALELGRWTFLAPIGYLNAPRWSGKSLVEDPERAPFVRRAFEDFATGRFTKKEVLAEITRFSLRTRRGLKVSPQAFDVMLENRLYIGILDLPDYGVHGRRGDFEPLISEELFYRVQGVLNGRIRIVAPRERNRPDFPLRGLVRCHACGRGLTASWSKRRNDRFAYYHCRPPCRAINISKTKLEGLFVEELERLQPTPGYMRLIKESVLRVWHERKAAIKSDTADQERRVKAIHQKLDRLDEAFIFAKTIDLDTYERQRDRLREELTLAQIDRHTSELEELDVEGILAFAERVVPCCVRGERLDLVAPVGQNRHEPFHPVGVLRQCLYVEQRLGLGAKGGGGRAVGAARLPPLAGLASGKEGFGDTCDRCHVDVSCSMQMIRVSSNPVWLTASAHPRAARDGTRNDPKHIVPGSSGAALVSPRRDWYDISSYRHAQDQSRPDA